jgi:hypothetical protein
VLQGIEAHTSKPPCRFVAKEMRDEAMGRFMKVTAMITGITQIDAK